MTECEDGLEVCCPSIGYSCGKITNYENSIYCKFFQILIFSGIRYPPVTESLKTANNQAAYGAYPYQAV